MSALIVAPAPAANRMASRTAIWLRELGLHVLAVGITVLVLGVGLRLDRADFHAPFSYEYDALLILPFVKEVIETGSHWNADRLGAPGTMQLHDFPVVDHLHLAIIWLLGQVWPEPVFVFNVFHLLTYPLTALTALFALRRLGIGAATGVALAILYTFQPYHYQRGAVHYFLSAYYVVPLTLLVTLDICRGQLPFFRRATEGRWAWSLVSMRSVGAILIAAATASAGAYYAFFSCFFLAAAGVYGWVAVRTWRAAACAVAMVALVGCVGVVNHAPTFRFQAEHGQNPRPRERQAEEAELYGMKIAQLILPVANHNPIGLGPAAIDFAVLRAMYQAPLVKDVNESDWDALGLVGALGYVGLLVSLCLPGTRRWPFGPLAALTAAGTLYGTVGGFGAVFNLMVSPQVRCVNRVSIFLAFLALAAVGFALDRFGRRVQRRFPTAGPLAAPVAAALIIFGIWDQTNDTWFPDVRMPGGDSMTVETARANAARKYLQDRNFFRRVETVLPTGMVFTYPFIEYPEAPPFFEPGAPGKTNSYDTTAGYLHTQSLRWSFGAMKGREWDAWQRIVAGREPTVRMLERITAAGFDGLLVDSRGLNPRRWQTLKQELEQHLGPTALREQHSARKLFFYDLRPYREALQASIGTVALAARSQSEHADLLTLWVRGFVTNQPAGLEERYHLASRRAEIALVNRSQQPMTADISMRLKTAFKGDARLRVVAPGLHLDDGPAWDDHFEIDSADGFLDYSRRVVVPPGRHIVRFECEPTVTVLPTESRRFVFAIRDYELNPLSLDPP